MTSSSVLRSTLNCGFVVTMVGCASTESIDTEGQTANDTVRTTFVSTDASGKPTLSVKEYSLAEFEGVVAARRQHQAKSTTTADNGEVGTANLALQQTNNCGSWSSLWLHDAYGELFCFEGGSPNPMDLATIPGFDLPVTWVWPGNVLGGYIGTGLMWCNGAGDTCDFWREYTNLGDGYAVSCNTSHRMVISPIYCNPT